MAKVNFSLRYSVHKVIKDKYGEKMSEIINMNAYDKTMILCDLIDILCAESECRDKRVSIDEAARAAYISVEIDYPIFWNGRSHPFFQYIRMADEMSIHLTKDSFVKLEFTVFNMFNDFRN